MASCSGRTGWWVLLNQPRAYQCKQQPWLLLEEGFDHSLSTRYGAPGFLTPFSMVLVWQMVPSAAGMLLVMQRLLLLRHHNSLQTSWKERDFGGREREGGRKRQRNKAEIRICLCSGLRGQGSSTWVHLGSTSWAGTQGQELFQRDAGWLSCHSNVPTAHRPTSSGRKKLLCLSLCEQHNDF